MRLNMIAMMVAAALAGTSTVAISQTAPRDTSTAKGRVVDAPPPNYADSMARLKEATQRLREAIQAMAQQEPGERRNVAIRQAHEALFDAQQAMIQLPPELYTDEGQKAEPNYTVATERLQQAAQKLRESVQAMAEQPAGPQRNAAARQAREAILETQQAMVYLPPQLRSESGVPGKGEPQASIGTGSVSNTASSRKTFSELDQDNDGFIGMLEAAGDADAKQNFKRLDKNNDLKLSRPEFEAGQAPAAGGAAGQAGRMRR